MALLIVFKESCFHAGGLVLTTQWFSTFSLNGAKSTLTTVLESCIKEILTHVNWHVLFYFRTKSVTQNIRVVIKRLQRAVRGVLRSVMRLSDHWLRTTGLHCRNLHKRYAVVQSPRAMSQQFAKDRQWKALQETTPLSHWDVLRAGLKPMQLRWAPRHGVWVDLLPDTPCAWEFSRHAV